MRAEQERATESELNKRLVARLPRRLVEMFAGAHLSHGSQLRLYFYRPGNPTVVMRPSDMRGIDMPYHDGFPNELDIAKLCLLIP